MLTHALKNTALLTTSDAAGQEVIYCRAYIKKEGMISTAQTIVLGHKE